MKLEATKRTSIACAVVVLTSSISAIQAQAQVAMIPNPTETPEDVVAGIYDLVSFEAGKTPDWDVVRSLFIPEAIIVLRTSLEASTVFSLEGFVDDFVNFIDNTPAGEMGFTETVIRMKSMVFGDMAHVLVLYESHITGSSRAPRQGVDSFSLIKKDGRWLIVSITNELPTAERPIPEVLRD